MLTVSFGNHSTSDLVYFSVFEDNPFKYYVQNMRSIMVIFLSFPSLLQNDTENIVEQNGENVAVISASLNSPKG